MKKILALVLAMLMVMSLVACGAKGEAGAPAKDEESKKVVIYTALSNVRADPIHESIVKQFPDYEIVFEYMGVSELGAKIANEGTETEVDIILDMGYAYLESLKDYLADHSQWNQDIFQEFMRVEDRKWMPFCMFSGCIAVNLDMLEAKGLPVPQSWEDLCDPMYKGLIEMPNPASSGTGYVFLQMLVDLWGEEAALAYFDELAPNVLAFTSSTTCRSCPSRAAIPGILTALLSWPATIPRLSRLSSPTSMISASMMIWPCSPSTASWRVTAPWRTSPRTSSMLT